MATAKTTFCGARIRRCGGMADGWSPDRQLPHRWKRLNKLDDIRSGRFRRRLSRRHFVARRISDVAIWLMDGPKSQAFTESEMCG